MSDLFRPIDGLHGVYAAQWGKLHCVVLHLNDTDICLYSPIAGMGQAAREALDQIGTCVALIAPNHYHNKGLTEHVELFPKARLIASAAAAPRLKKITGLDFEDMSALQRMLPGNVQTLEPAGLKTGEFWLSVTKGAETAWIVTDAFSSAHHPAGTDAKEPTLLGTFPKYGIKESAVFKAWVAQQLARQAPTLLLPCHGSPVKSPNLAVSMMRLLDRIP
ncbi:MAG: hypothetical protein AAFQ09_07075 [Pseudomonadota bacterium]